MHSQIVKFTKDSHLQRIKDSYFDEETERSLTVYEKDLSERLRYLYSKRLRDKYSKEQTLELYMKEYKVSRSTAYRHYDLSMQLHGEIDEVNLKAEKNIIRANYYFLYQKAVRNDDLELARRCMDSYCELFDFSKDGSEIDIDKIRANEYQISIDKLSKKLFSKQFDGGVVNMNLSAEDIDFEEMEDE